MPEIVRQAPGIVTVVSQLISASMPQHMRVNPEGQPRRHACARPSRARRYNELAALGRKTGGRRRGTPNKTTVEKALLAALAAAEGTGKKLAKEVIEDFMLRYAEMAAHVQPAPPGAPPNPHADEDKFWSWPEAAIDCAVKLAPYQSPTFKAVTVVPPPPAPPSVPEHINFARLDPEEAMRVYKRIMDGEDPWGHREGVAQARP